MPLSGNEGSISLHFVYQFATRLPSFGNSFASARKICSIVSVRRGALFPLARTMPSYPIFTSLIVTPFLVQSWNSVGLMRRDAFAMSGVSGPTPAQNSLSPPPVPVDSTTGVLK